MNKQRLNVLLVKPYIVTDEIQPPLGLGYLATTIRDKHNVKIIDGIKEKVRLNDFKKEIEKENYDLIGIQCYTFDKPVVRDMIMNIKKVNQDIITLIGGPDPSSDTDGVYDYSHADFGFKGEAEVGFPMFVDYVSGDRINLHDIPGLIWKDNGAIKVNPQIVIDNLDDLGYPSWDLLNPHTYPNAPHGAFFKKTPIAPILATRGCPCKCTFCAGFLISGRKIRYRTVSNFVDEIEMLHKKYGINEIHIEDDNFSYRRQFAIDFAKELIRRGIDISWAFPNGIRLDTIDKESAELMKKAGLYVVSVGIESGSDEILKEMKKGIRKDTIREKIRILDQAGLDIAGFFILGYPGETKQDINDTINFACELPLKRVSFMLFKPFPGTEAGSGIIKEMEGQEINWENFALNSVVYAPHGMSKKQLKHLRKKALIKFYFRPKIIYSFFKSIKSFDHAKYIFRRVFRWLL